MVRPGANCRKRLTPFPTKGFRFALRLEGAVSALFDARSAQSVFPTYTPPENDFVLFRRLRAAELCETFNALMPGRTNGPAGRFS